MNDKIALEKDVSTALKGTTSDAPARPVGSAAEPASPARTVATPDYDGVPAPNFERRVEFEEKPMAEFQSSQTLLGSNPMAVMQSSSLKCS